MKINNVSLLLLIPTLLWGWSSCSHEGHDHDHEHHHEAEEHHHDVDDDDEEVEHHHSPDDILLSVEKAQAAGIEVQDVKRGIFHSVIQTSGTLQPASCDETTVVATASGVVSHSHHISEGMAIQGGSVIYYLNSSQLQEGDQARKVEIAYLTAKREYERAQPLADEQIISQKDFAAIKSEYENALLAYEAIGKNTSGKGVAVKAPVSGFLKECMVKDGDYVQVGDPLMVITRNQHLYLRVEVPVRYYSVLSQITSAKFRTQYSDEVYDLQKMDGELMSSGKSAVSTSSYVPVTFKIDNDGSIVPGSYAEVFLITGERQGVLSVPTSALTEEQGVYYVYLQENEHTYHKREVMLGDTDGEFTEIKNGLNDGERVVVRGAINVKLAGASNAIPAHTHNH